MTPKQKKAVSMRMKAYWDERRRTKELPENTSPKTSIDVRVQYHSLSEVLTRAYDQAAVGKGAERHAQSLPFDAQPMQTISSLIGTHNGMLYQAIKKVQESNRLPHERAVAELLGAINYIAGAIIYLEKQNAEVQP